MTGLPANTGQTYLTISEVSEVWPEVAESLTERPNFWRHVRFTRRCWLYDSSIKDTGYAQHWFEGKAQPAHRVAWIILGRELPTDRRVLHTCDTRNCVHPDHLFLGTSAENTADMDAKGRRTHRGPRPSLTEPQVYEIRRRRKNGETLKALGQAFGVTDIAIWKIDHRETWKHLPEEEAS